MPAPPDSTVIEDTIIGVLSADAALRALLPHGIYADLAPANARAFGIVSLVEARDVAQFGGRSYEDVALLIKAVCASSSGATCDDAAARIAQLLEDVPLTIAGYGWMTTHREERVRYTEVDQVDAALRWQHRGGRYRVQVAIA